MNQSRSIIYAGLAALTILFIGAAVIIYLDGEEDTPNITEPISVGEAPQALRLTVAEEGVVALTAQQVRGVGMPFDTFSPEHLRLTLDGKPIPFVTVGEGLDAVLYFYATGVVNTLQPPPVYWLTPGKGEQMEVKSGARFAPSQSVGYSIKKWEDDLVFLPLARGEDLWMGRLIVPPAQFEIPLDSVSPTGGPAELTVRIWSNNETPANPDHHVELLLNGASIADRYWEGIKEQTIVARIDAGILQPEDNVLTINAPLDTGAAVENLFLDWVTLLYEANLNAGNGAAIFTTDAGTIRVEEVTEDALVFNITQPIKPTMIIGGEYNRDAITFAGSGQNQRYIVLKPHQAIQPQLSLAPQWDTIKTPNRGADYVAIVGDAPEFDEALTPLLKHRASQGLRVASFSITQIYDEFSFGRRDPTAIRDFLVYATQNWQPAPRFLLLVGDASYDAYGNIEGNNSDLTPTYLVDTQYAGFAASDTWFTILDEESLTPAIAIGRFPAQTAEQLEVMAQKTIAYEMESQSEWTGKALLVSDDEENFDAVSDLLAVELLSSGYEAQKVYLSQEPDVEANHNAIIGAINQGVGIINYVGHGSPDVWGDEKVFQIEDAAQLANRDRLPIFTTFTCLNGLFNHPQIDALAETLLWTKDGGVVAAVAPSGRTTTSQQSPIADMFYAVLLSGEAETLGEALQAAKAAEAGNENLKDVIHTFNLLGDPALRFQLPAASLSSNLDKVYPIP